MIALVISCRAVADSNLLSFCSTFFALGLGNYTLVITATDSGNNSVTCTSVVSVVDEEAPLIDNCPTTEITLMAPAGMHTAFVDAVSMIGARDNDPDSFNIPIVPGPSVPTDGHFPIGSTSAIYTATDNAGNVGKCLFIVTVLASPAASTSLSTAGVTGKPA